MNHKYKTGDVVQYKKGDIIQYNEYTSSELGEDEDCVETPMIVLGSRIVEAAGDHWVQYLVMRGDETFYVFEGWVVPVK